MGVGVHTRVCTPTRPPFHPTTLCTDHHTPTATDPNHNPSNKHNQSTTKTRPIFAPGRVSRTTSLFMDMKERSLVERAAGAVGAARAWLWQFRVRTHAR